SCRKDSSRDRTPCCGSGRMAQQRQRVTSAARRRARAIGSASTMKRAALRMQLSANAPAGGTCGTRPCWAENSVGFKYANKGSHARRLGQDPAESGWRRLREAQREGERREPVVTGIAADAPGDGPIADLERGLLGRRVQHTSRQRFGAL